MIEIAILNESTVVSDPDISAAAAALQIQLDRDFTPIWGIPAHLTAVPKGHMPPVTSWWLAVVDDATMAGALALHERNNAGLPIGFIFAKTCAADNVTWTSALSHELLEMLVDPECQLSAEIDNNKGQFSGMLNFECADPVEDASYMINGVEVSDFVTPHWFCQGGVSGPFDFLKKLTAPMPAMLPGGYYIELQIKSGRWIESTAKRPAHHGQMHARCMRKPEHGSRRERRMRGKQQWKSSNYAPKVSP